MHRIAFLGILLLFAVFAEAMSVMPAGFHSLPNYPFVVVADKGNRSNLILPESLFDELAISVQFKTNSYEVDPNTPFIKLYNETLLPYLNEHGLQLVKIYIRGAASPEGTVQRNTTLAKKRTEALITNLSSKNESRHPIISESIPEEYRRLVKLMHDAEDIAYERVKTLYDTYQYDPVKLKEMLMADKILWNRLSAQYFPTLRSARVVLLCIDKDDVDAFEGNRYRKDPITSTNPFAADSINMSRLKLYDFNLSASHPAEDIEPPMIGTIKHKRPRRELLSVKTNLLMDFAYMPAGYDRFCPMPNIGIEYYPLKGHFTFGAFFDIPWHQDYDGHKYFQARNYQLETRYYFRSGSIRKNPPGEGAAFRGFYISSYAHAGLYSVCINANHGYEGEGYGGGLGLGYVIGLGKRQHWRLELGVQGGYFYTRYDPYQWLCPVQPDLDPQLYYYKWYGNAEDFVRRQYRYTWLGPTRAEITLSYDLLYRRIHKKGISFRSKEKHQNNKKKKK